MKIGPALNEKNLVFGYDAGSTAGNLSLSNNRYYKGPEITNKLEVLNTSYSNTQNANFYAVAGTEEVYIPKVGRRTVKYVEYFNNYPNSGNCCPNLFYYFDGFVTGIEPSTSYTYSIIYKHTGNYTHPNFMYQYQYNSSGTYLGEVGYHSTSRRNHLGGGWYHAWGTLTTASTTSQMRFYSFLYNYGTTKYKYYVAAISFVKNIGGGSHFIIPPQQMIPPSTSTTSTNSLIDLTKTRDIAVTNVSFDPNGLPVFDGTDDFIDLGSDVTFKSSGGWTVESVVKYNSVPGSYNGSTSPGNFIGAEGISYNSWYWSVLGSKLAIWNISPGVWKYGSTTIQANTWYHTVLTCSNDGTSYQMYLNGVAEGGTHASYSFNASYSGLKVRYFGMGKQTAVRRINGYLPVSKIYDRVLTDREIKANYNQYKNRFNF